MIASCRHHPVLLTTPLAAIAVGAGFAAQALLHPAPDTADRALLETLIAQPSPPSPGASQESASLAAPTGRRSGAAPSSLASDALQAHRAASSSRGGALEIPETGPELQLEIRVALLKLASRPRLSANGPWRLLDRQGRVLQRGEAGQAVDPSAALQGVSEAWLESTPGASVEADGRSYEGRFRLLQGDGRLLVVNHLPLERYISSVVGGEMPSHWNLEALRAQAVAARSYAMAHMARPADAHWHLGDTTRWQNYTGLSSVNARTREATASTAGVILSFQGGIVESLYAATQQIVDEAHGHLGASMSQTGAQELAQRGLRYNEILGRYYRGASLARLQAGAG